MLPTRSRWPEDLTFERVANIFTESARMVERWVELVRSPDLVGLEAVYYKLGHLNPSSGKRFGPGTIIDCLIRAQRRGVDVTIRQSAHLTAMPFLPWLRLLGSNVKSHLVHHRYPLGSVHAKATLFKFEDGSSRLIVGSADLVPGRWSSRNGLWLTHETGLELVTDPGAANAGHVLRFYAPGRSAINWGDEWVRLVRSAEYSVYIEDQFFALDFGVKYGRQTVINPLDIVVKKLEEGVDVVVVTNKIGLRSGITVAPSRLLSSVRDSVLRRLQRFSNFTCMTVERDGHPVFVHSKLLIVDDRIVAIGSPNVDRRSHFFDCESVVLVEDYPTAAVLRGSLSGFLIPMALPNDPNRPGCFGRLIYGSVLEPVSSVNYGSQSR